MGDGHLSRRLLMKLVRGEDWLPEPEVRQLLHHILATCPECQARYEGVVEAWKADRAGEYGPLADTLLQRLAGRGSDAARLSAEAEEDCAALLKLEGAERRLRIQRALSRFRSPRLVDRLLDESQKSVVKDPYRALDLAESAHEVALRIPQDQYPPGWVMTSVARANTHRGNALRVLGDFRAAEKLLSIAYSLFQREGTGDPLVEAEILKMYARVCLEQRRFGEAEKLFDLSLSLFQKCGQERQVAETLIAKAILYSGSDRTPEAVATLEEALAHIDPREEERLFLYTQHNLAHYLRDGGELEKARDLVAANAELYARFPEPLLQLRKTWLAATIARDLGQLREAEEGLTEVRSGFLDQGLGYDAALAGLDLALVHVAAGKPREIRALAEEMVPVFLAQEIHREAMAAVVLFKEAARQEEVTERMVLELARALKQVRRKPERRAS